MSSLQVWRSGVVAQSSQLPESCRSIGPPCGGPRELPLPPVPPPSGPSRRRPGREQAYETDANPSRYRSIAAYSSACRSYDGPTPGTTETVVGRTRPSGGAYDSCGRKVRSCKLPTQLLRGDGANYKCPPLELERKGVPVTGIDMPNQGVLALNLELADRVGRADADLNRNRRKLQLSEERLKSMQED